MEIISKAECQNLIDEIWGKQPFEPEKQNNKWVQIAREAYKAKEYRKRYEELEKKLMEQLVEISENKECYAGGFKLEQIDVVHVHALAMIAIKIKRK